MSLEIEIQKLTTAVQLLTEVIQGKKDEQERDDVAVKSSPEPEAKSEVKSEVKSEAKAKTADDLKALCLAKVREDKDMKTKIKQFLSDEYGVKKTSEVSDDKVAEVYARIEKGDL